MQVRYYLAGEVRAVYDNGVVSRGGEDIAHSCSEEIGDSTYRCPQAVGRFAGD